MTLARNTWVSIREQSLASYAREAGFDLAVFDEYSEEVQTELRRRAIERAVAAIKESFWEKGIDIASIKRGVYVISLSSPLTLKYQNKFSQVIYVGLGNVMGRIKAHFDHSLFDFMQSLSGANFDFHFAHPGRRGCADYYKHVEWQMLEYFKRNYGGLSENQPYPILNKNAGSKRKIDDQTLWWTKPLKNNGKTPRWAMSPTPKSDFVRLA
jgi:hypothetical protein